MEGYFDGASRGNPGKAGAGALMINEEGKPVWADESETTYQFNKSRCHGFILNVLSTYFKIRCKV